MNPTASMNSSDELLALSSALEKRCSNQEILARKSLDALMQTYSLLSSSRERERTLTERVAQLEDRLARVEKQLASQLKPAETPAPVETQQETAKTLSRLERHLNRLSVVLEEQSQRQK